jgi:chromosomal replication initiator protein
LDKPETNLEIPDTVIDLIARNIQSNIRDLEAAIMQLVAYGDLTNKPITLETAHTQLKDSLTHKQSNVSLDVIAKVITEHFHLSPNDLRAKKKPQKIVYPRQLAMYIAGEITQGTTTEIGEFFNKDHTTVLHSVKKIKETIKSDSTIGSLVHELIRSIKETSIK